MHMNKTEKLNYLSEIDSQFQSQELVVDIFARMNMVGCKPIRLYCSFKPTKEI